MLIKYNVSCTPRQFAAWVRELTVDASEQWRYIVDSEDENRTAIHWGYLRYKAMSTWVGDLGSATILPTGDRSVFILTAYCHNSLWGKLAPIWQYLLDILVMQKLIISP